MQPKRRCKRESQRGGGRTSVKDGEELGMIAKLGVIESGRVDRHEMEG